MDVRVHADGAEHKATSAAAATAMPETKPIAMETVESKARDEAKDTLTAMHRFEPLTWIPSSRRASLSLSSLLRQC